MPELLTLYARREPTTDKVLRAQQPDIARQKRDVMIYRDAAAEYPYARFSWDQVSKPIENVTQEITLNTYRWALKWLPEVTA